MWGLDIISLRNFGNWVNTEFRNCTQLNGITMNSHEFLPICSNSGLTQFPEFHTGIAYNSYRLTYNHMTTWGWGLDVIRWRNSRNCTELHGIPELSESGITWNSYLCRLVSYSGIAGTRSEAFQSVMSSADRVPGVSWNWCLWRNWLQNVQQRGIGCILV